MAYKARVLSSCPSQKLLMYCQLMKTKYYSMNCGTKNMVQSSKAFSTRLFVQDQIFVFCGSIVSASSRPCLPTTGSGQADHALRRRDGRCWSLVPLLLSSVTLSLCASVDADWGGFKENRKSPFGWAMDINGKTVFLRTRKQSTIHISSAESEYITLFDAKNRCAGCAYYFRRCRSKSSGQREVFYLSRQLCKSTVQRLKRLL